MQCWKEGKLCTAKEGRNRKSHSPHDFKPFTRFTLGELQSALAGMQDLTRSQYAYEHYSSSTLLTFSVVTLWRRPSPRK